MLSKRRPGRSAALLATLLLVPLGALHGAAAGLGSVTATRLADFPPGLSLRVLPGAGNDFDPELIELAESLLRDQGADVSAGTRYTLYLRRIVSSSNRADKPRIAISGTGGGRRVDDARVEVQIPLEKKKKRSATPPASTYGLEGSLEGPGGLVYWRVRILARDLPSRRKLDDTQLLRQGLQTFGLTVVRELHEPPG